MSVDLTYIEVTPNIIMTAMVTEESNQLVRPYLTSNMSCIAFPSGLVFMDCGPRTDVAKKFREDMEQRFSRETTHLILTDKVWDHIYGMNAFEDVTVISSSATKSGIRQNLKKGVTTSMKEFLLQQFPEDEQFREILIDANLFVPTKGFSKREILGSNPNHLAMEVYWAGAIYVYAQSERVLFTGNGLQSCKPPLIWPITGPDLYRKWESFQIDYIVPGHGPVVDKNYLSSIRQWFEDIHGKLRQFRDQGLKESQILKQELPEYPGKKQVSWIEGSPYHTKIVQDLTKFWYRQILKEGKVEDDQDMIFIS